MKQLISNLFDEGLKYGFTDMEVIINQSDSFDVKIYDNEIDSYKVADSKGLGFRGVYQGKMGYSYTEKLAQDSIEILLREAGENALINDSPDQDVIFEGSKSYEQADNYTKSLDDITVETKIDFAKQLESIAKSLDSRVKSCPYCMFASASGSSILSNTKGLYLEDKSNMILCFVEALVQEGEDLSEGFAYCYENDFSKFDAHAIAKEAVDEAVAYLGAKPIKSGVYKSIMLNTAAADLLGAISSSFSARSVQKGISFLKGKLGESVASDAVTLVDDPFLPGKAGTASFDGEGVATKYKKIIDKGVLDTYLHNLKTAQIDGVESTGNASRSYKSNIGVSAFNLYYEKGEKTLEQLQKQMADGIVITEVSALHSGFDAISGDFSLPAKGYTIKDGKKDRYFRQITISGNYFEMIKDVLEMADDLKFASNGRIGSPSMYISKISVAGE